MPLSILELPWNGGVASMSHPCWPCRQHYSAGSPDKERKKMKMKKMKEEEEEEKKKKQWRWAV